MSVYNTVTDLYADVQAYMDRNEASIVNKIPMWVHMAEDELDRRLRHPASVVSREYTLTKGSNVIPAPEALLELRYICRVGSTEHLYRRSIETLYHPPFPANPYIATAFAAKSNTFILNAPASEDTQYEIVYNMAPEKLSTTNTNNLYLSALGDFLLYASLASGFAYDLNSEEAMYYRNLAEGVLATMNEQIEAERIAGSTMVLFGDMDYIDCYY